MRLETEEDVLRLIEQGVPESYHFEYKRQPWPKNKKGNVELAKDISAFANTEGGVIIIGIDEDKKTKIKKTYPIEFGDIKDRITTVLEQNVKDPIPGYRIQLIPPGLNDYLLDYQIALSEPLEAQCSSVNGPVGAVNHKLGQSLSGGWCNHCPVS